MSETTEATKRALYTMTVLMALAEAESRAIKAEARVQSLLMRHNANHGDGASVTCKDCIEARAILAAQKEGSK